MRKHHPKNERIKRRYLMYLEEAKRMSVKSTDQIAAAIALFEESTGYKDFAQFHIEQARRFKRLLGDHTNLKTGKPLAKATIHSRLMALKAFFHWLAGQPGYKSRISYSDSDYFNPSANDSRIATARREKVAPSLSQVHSTIDAMREDSTIEKRDRALIAFAILTGARDDAIASFSLRHIDLNRRLVFQDARHVRTKFRKTFATWFFPVGGKAEAIVRNWIGHLENEQGFGPDDPVFPQTDIGLDGEGRFSAVGVKREHWNNAAAIRKIFRAAFTGAGFPAFNPHSMRTTLARLGEQVCKSPMEFKAWSQNLGHEDVLTTFRSYGEVPVHEQEKIMRGFSTRGAEDVLQTPSSDMIKAVLKHLADTSA